MRHSIRLVSRKWAFGARASAIFIIGAVVWIFPRWPLGRLLYAVLLLAHARTGAAVGEAKIAAELNPNSIHASRIYGTALFRRRRFNEAALQFQRWTDLSPGDGIAFFLQGRSLIRANRRHAGLNALRRASAVDFSLWRCHRLMGILAKTENNLWWAELHFGNSTVAKSPPHHLTSKSLLRRIAYLLIDLLVEAVDQIFICRALILREIRLKYRTNPFGVIFEFIRPVAIDVAHYFYYVGTQRPVPGHQYAVFTITGFAIWFAFSSAMHGAQHGAQWPSGVIQLPGVTRMHLRVASAVWVLLMNLLFAAIWVLPLMAFGADLRVPDILQTVVVYLIAVVMGFGYGLSLEGMGRLWPMVIPFFEILNWCVFITSGVYDSISLMPHVMAQYIIYNPIIHIAEFARQAYWSAYPVFFVNLVYPTIWAVAMLFLGLLVNRCLRRIKPA